MKVRFKKLSPDAVIPRYAHDTDAGMDLTATRREFDNDGNVVYHTDLAMEIPQGYVGLIFPRLALSTLATVARSLPSSSRPQSSTTRATPTPSSYLTSTSQATVSPS